MNTPRLTCWWRLLHGVTRLLDGTDDQLRLLPGRRPIARETVTRIPQEILSCFEAGWSEDAAGSDPDNEDQWLVLLDWLSTFKALGLLRLELRCGSETLATLIPHANQFELPSVETLPDALVAKPFLYARPCTDGIVLDEPDTPVTAILHCDELRRVAFSRSSVQLDEVSKSTRDICRLLAALGFFQVPGVDTKVSPTWEFHDRLFLNQIQSNNHIEALGATYRFGANSPADVEDGANGNGLALPDPERSSRSFDEVLQLRRSRRYIGKTAITLERLGELLARSWRDVKIEHKTRGIRRPFPSGGAIHELDLIIIARSVVGLAPGAYRYCSQLHELHPVDLDSKPIDYYCDQVRAMPGVSGNDLGCLLIVRSRFPKLAWVYEKIAMKLTLMNSGAALQTLQLSATDMGLNSWIIGAGLDFDYGNGSADANEFSVGGLAIAEPN